MQRHVLRLIGLLCMSLAVAGCGGDEADDSAAVDGGAGRPTPTAILALLSERVTDGSGLSDVTWSADVQAVALALWPNTESPTALAAMRDHTHLAHIAGDMAARFAADDGARDAALETDPLSVRIYDGFVLASGGAPDVYRTWVEGPGRALLEERFQALAGERPR